MQAMARMVFQIRVSATEKWMKFRSADGGSGEGKMQKVEIFGRPSRLVRVNDCILREGVFIF
jgi:hypothetical protein